ncbi:MAG: hypothetical protein HXY34_06115 [Candidatus Thorarchaeota archaeon]|nr:hypothetical protein [Candidatus Thorarchaeota archaeon]
MFTVVTMLCRIDSTAQAVPLRKRSMSRYRQPVLVCPSRFGRTIAPLQTLDLSSGSLLDQKLYVATSGLDLLNQTTLVA